ncbi:AraC family transcriptional regulator [Ferrovibrio terrae]|uniref:AraC family transcriptional regulator n=1 Tax=Ferrovibrio terrae TaxID=2594003 RepID=A0A516H255_9PROT|nr:AraC family transcriptional regulator [Ferrovibrio terrae]QDO97852.1 AraC family transcriptional regulator [Ferrovibrio terrae]
MTDISSTDSASQASYLRRFTRVIEYIYAHLDESPDLNTLAEVAALSPYHWHRTWQAVYGESVVNTVKRLRLQRAAADLAHSEMPLEAIGSRAGYGSLAAFSRGFKDSYGMTPSDYRKAGSHAHFKSTQNAKEGAAMPEVTIRHVPAAKMAVVPHRGSYMEIGKAFETLFGTLGARGLLRPGLCMKGIYYSDPTSVPEAELRSAAGILLPDDDFPVAPPLERAELRGGDYAVLRHKGPYTDMRPAYDWLYGEWLVQSGREAADAPCFEDYLNNPREVAPSELLTDICLPLK